MRLPVTTAVAISSMLTAARYGNLTYTAGDFLSTPAYVVGMDQSVSALPVTTASTEDMTLVTFIASEFTDSTMVSPHATETITSSPSSPPPLSMTTSSFHPSQSSTATSIATKSVTTTSIPSTSISTTVTTATSTSDISTSATPVSATAAPATSAATTSPTQSTVPYPDSTEWAAKGKIAGTVAGSVLGLIFLGVLCYALFAVTRGVNVCDCCACHFGKRNEEEGRLPSRSSDTYPYPEGNNPGPGTGYYRPARPVMLGPLPWTLPQQAEDEHRAGKLSRTRGW
ncbi:hypothetical protein GMOD_00009231 [Pyrenophora seminiperda CCB06]|uniref:Uncharacterized protein n=1 Tax=Pyrenophora seminiperda CCB06 TaxID=1302712 RepID=A0A3M7MBI9_9PLEO|nr:hypothetical protein GMOD_00009231 [Pyrenophora seminiperda CCB06]